VTVLCDSAGKGQHLFPDFGLFVRRLAVRSKTGSPRFKRRRTLSGGRFTRRIENNIYNEMKSLGTLTSKKLDNYSEEFPNKKYIKLTNER